MRTMTARQAADYLGVSRSYIYRLIKAREFDDAIAAGTTTPALAPDYVRPCLGMGFPRLFYPLGSRTYGRLDATEVETWWANRCKQAREVA